MGSRASGYCVDKSFCPTRIQTLNHPACGLVSTCTCYPGSSLQYSQRLLVKDYQLWKIIRWGLLSLVYVTITTLAFLGTTLQQVISRCRILYLCWVLVRSLYLVPHHRIVYGVGVQLYILPAVHPGVWCKTLQKNEGLSFTLVKA
jgi:hypothetical protein